MVGILSAGVLGQTDAGRYLFVVVIQSPVVAIPGDRPSNDRRKNAASGDGVKDETEVITTNRFIQELAQFWDTYDLTDCEDELKK